MTVAATRNAVRNPRPKAPRAASARKTAERRAELAEAALQTLSTLGYARTSLREIAQNSVFSHGVLHYYFADKVDLITACVRQYKARCVTRYDRITAEATTYAELEEGFLASLARTAREEAQMHRLWYDLRAQALFEACFRDDVAAIDRSLEDMVWRIVSRFAELAGKPVGLPPAVMYATVDGLFQRCILKHLSGNPDAVDEMVGLVRTVLPR